ncbi:MAG: erythromycin esterase family protein [Planctomycetes bacterium]|nr:erythromycin esterase family protein [Planctomycetota bacterium]
MKHCLPIVAVVIAVTCAACYGQGDAAVTRWVKANAVKLDTVEAGHGFADMQPIKAMVGSARIVGLGEATHGTREFFQLKHRMVEFLVEEMGFTIFAI